LCALLHLLSIVGLLGRSSPATILLEHVLRRKTSVERRIAVPTDCKQIFLVCCFQCVNDTSVCCTKTLTSITRAANFAICKTERISLCTSWFMVWTSSLGEKASCVWVFCRNRRLLSREITARVADRRCEEGLKEVTEAAGGGAELVQPVARFGIDFDSVSCSQT
jgi:hypothetical protein